MVGAKYTLASFRHRVAVCSMKDVVTADGGMSLSRQDVYRCWAAIIPSVKTLFGPGGDAVKQSRDVRTHILVLRARHDLDLSQSAWFYEQRLQTGGRWFKLLAMIDQNECGAYWECDVRLVERGFAMSAPAPEAASQSSLLQAQLPGGVKL